MKDACDRALSILGDHWAMPDADAARLARTCKALAERLMPGLRKAHARQQRAHRQRVRALFFGPHALFPPLAAHWCAPDVNVTVETAFRISATTGRVVLTERLFSDANEERSHTVIALTPQQRGGRFAQLYRARDGPYVFKVDAFDAGDELFAYLRRWTVQGQYYWPCEHPEAFVSCLRSIASAPLPL